MSSIAMSISDKTYFNSLLANWLQCNSSVILNPQNTIETRKKYLSDRKKYTEIYAHLLAVI